MSELTFSMSEAYEVLKPLAGFVLGILVYGIFIFKFYRFLSKRDIIDLDLARYTKKGYRFLRFILYIIQYVLLFPLLTFFWFAVLTTLLSVLGKNQTPESILLTSIALVSTVRATAYYNEDLSKDLAKMLPFALLGIYLVDQSYFELSVSFEIVKEMPDLWSLIVYYLMFTIALEFVLRVGYGIKSSLWPRRSVSSDSSLSAKT